MYVTVGFHEEETANGSIKVRPAEVFVKVAKHGTEISGLMDALTTIISIALQSSIPWEHIERKLRHHHFGTYDKHFTSITDAVAVTVSNILGHRVNVVGANEPDTAAPNILPRRIIFNTLNPVVDQLIEEDNTPLLTKETFKQEQHQGA